MHEPDAITVRRLGVSGPAVLVLHGGPGAPGSARGLAQILAQRFTVFEPLQRRSGSVPLSVEQHVQDLAAVAPAPALIVGHSWGAMLGLSYAARYPAAVSKLVLVGCGSYDEATRAQLRASLQERLGPAGRQRLAELQAQPLGETNLTQRESALQQLGDIQSKLETFAPIEHDSDTSELLPVDSAGHTETWNDAIRLQRDGVEPQSFSQIRACVLMIHGDDDLHPGAATRDLLRQYIPQLEYLNLERCGHEPWREQYARESFAEALCVWLERT
ncbi:MAG TPA: alpha/beta hydrolase [Polyangiaceae bacterium]|jgi:pimeloyl-ACP methyl ester carboxylesterase